MPVKAKVPAKPEVTPKVKARVMPEAAAQDNKEANRLRQQRFLEKHRDEINVKRRERYAELKEAGRCPRCGKKLRSRKNTLCKDCLAKARDYNQKIAALP